MFCQYCGTKLPDDAKVCTGCGREVPPSKSEGQATVTPPAQAAPPRPGQGTATQKAAARPKKETPLHKRVPVLVAVVVCIVAVLLLRGLGKGGASKPGETPEYVSRDVSQHFLYDLYSDGNVTVTGMDGDVPAKLKIPEKLDGHPVTAVGDFAFRECASLTSVTLPKGLKTIEDYAFTKCSSLANVEIPDSVTFIGENAFGGTPWLAEQTDEFVLLGDGVLFKYNGGDGDVVIPKGVKVIGDSTFRDCVFLASVTVPEGVTAIGPSGFSYCKSLMNVTLPDSLKTIGTGAFSGCPSLTSVTIPRGVTTIEEDAFAECTSLADITIPTSVSTIGNHAFYSTPWLAGQADDFVVVGDGVLLKYNGAQTDVVVPDTVKTMVNAFFCHGGITSVTIPAGVTRIGAISFSGCSSLTSVNIENGVKEIGPSAFHYCTALTTMVIPKSVTAIDESAFVGCDKLTLTVSKGSFAETWAQQNQVPYVTK